MHQGKSTVTTVLALLSLLTGLVPRVVGTRKRTRRVAIPQVVVDRLDRTPRPRDHDERTRHEERDVHEHEKLPPGRSCLPPVVPHPHVRLELDADERREQGADEGEEVVEEGDGLGDDEADGASEADAAAEGQHGVNMPRKGRVQ